MKSVFKLLMSMVLIFLLTGFGVTSDQSTNSNTISFNIDNDVGIEVVQVTKIDVVEFNQALEVKTLLLSHRSWLVMDSDYIFIEKLNKESYLSRYYKPPLVRKTNTLRKARDCLTSSQNGNLI